MKKENLSGKLKIAFLLAVIPLTVIASGTLPTNDLPPLPHLFQNGTPADARKANENLDYLARLVKEKKALIKSFAPIGSVWVYSGRREPKGFYECDGRAVSRDEHPELFAAIGTIYGKGDGSSTFNIPDYRGYFLRGLDNGADRDPSADSRLPRPDGVGGDNVGTIQEDEFAAHDHTEDARPGSSRRGGDGSGANDFTLRGTYRSGDNGGSETRPKNISVMYIIKAG